VIRRPFSALAALGTAAHHGFETRSGVGLVFEPFLGRRAATVMWSAAIPAWLLVAARGSSRWANWLAFNAGTSLAGSLVHFVVWPWSLKRGIPMLDAAEGLTDDELPAYNAILLSWMAASALALALETPRSARAAALAGLASGELLRRSARHHFEWARVQAERNPEAWSAALREPHVRKHRSRAVHD
jgi:hypothetical protein